MFELTPQMVTIVLLAMMFCSMIGEFYIPATLRVMQMETWWKQKDYWLDNEPNKLYRNDYKAAVIIIGFIWTCFVHIPLVLHIIYCGWSYEAKAFLVMFMIDWIIHSIIDDLRTNRHKINLCVSQLINLFTVIMTWLIYFEEVG